MSRDQERQPEGGTTVAGSEGLGSGAEGVDAGRSSLCCGSGTVKGLAGGMDWTRLVGFRSFKIRRSGGN